MKLSDNALNVMAARTFKGIGRAWISKNMSNNIDVIEIIKLLNKDSKEYDDITFDDFSRKKVLIKNIILKSNSYIDGVVAIGDDDFPKHRGIVKNSEKPVFIFYRGNLSLLNEKNKNIAVIGLLTPDEKIIEKENKVVSELVKSGWVIVSGLALGCDTVAHRKALDLKGLTIAILPSPLNNITPASNIKLAEEIISNNGLIISEYLTEPKSKMEFIGRYQERDRLQALFSDAIILSASYAKNDLGNDSGSRLAMDYALKYSIPRGVIYDDFISKNNHKYDLNRQLITDDVTVKKINESNVNAFLEDAVLNNKIDYVDSKNQVDLF